MHQSFAGDVYNSAIYLKRAFAQTDTAFVSVVGNDKLSQNLLSICHSEDLNTNFVFKHPSRTLGVYLIETDNSGERSFSYWREHSAAKVMFDFLQEAEKSHFNAGDTLMFSGISLAILEPQQVDKFWTFLEQLKAKGVTIIFDPNYRACLWQDESTARLQFDRALSYADIALPGVEDFEVLYGLHCAEEILDYCSAKACAEIVVKNGPHSVITKTLDTQQHRITPVQTVVDTTSAGDAFNGVYIGARVNGQSIEQAVQFAAKAAGVVIQHSGAVIPKDVFVNAIKL